MLEGLTPPLNKSLYCKVDLLAKDLSDADAKILMAAIEDTHNWTANGLSRALRAKGVNLADTTIGKHRNRSCTCFRK